MRLTDDLQDEIHRILIQLDELKSPDDHFDDEGPESTKDWEDYYDTKAELGEQAVGIIRELTRARGMGMSDLANLVAAARSKNDYQLNGTDRDGMRQAERTLIRISGAYAVPDLFGQFLRLVPEVKG